jgi:FAD/FMN-containing dehydrogenase
MSSKVSQYLNEHLAGEVTTNEHVRKKFATDGSVLHIVPDMVVYPRTTSDLRKVARFSWQLAEKGHKLSITPRGGGTDLSGAAIGDGVILSMASHMNAIFEIDAKQKLVRVQPGVTFKALNDALKLHNLFIPSYPTSHTYSTIGGAIANNASGVLSGKYGSTGEWTHQLEVVLANGEVLQTGRQSKRDVAKKRGLQTFEGEIYRSLDNLINDNDTLIDQLAVDARDNAGYNIVDVKHRDGSIDLTPLFVGSQGTLGIVSEVILKAEPLPVQPLVGAVAFQDHDTARDGLDSLRLLFPSLLELIDGSLFAAAVARGKRYPFYSDALDQGDVKSVVLFEFDVAGDHAKKKIAKRIAKLFEGQAAHVAMERDGAKIPQLQHLATVTSLHLLPDKSDESVPLLLEGAYVPPEQFESFTKAVAEIEKKVHVDLPLCGHAADHIYYARPFLSFSKVSDRQKVFKLLAEWTAAVAGHDGVLIGEAGEGRLKAAFAYKTLDDDVKKLYIAIRELFDPLDILNTGVKQPVELKKLASSLRNDYDGSDFSATIMSS